MAWNDLPLSDKARMMQLAVSSGITDLRTIEEVYNKFAEGGKIHIKPENRGKFTALKKKTGHSASWFKAHGTPAQKKMATFALNARKWHHAEGGPLPDLYQSKYQVTPYYGPLSPETIEAAEREIANPTSPKAYEKANKVLRTFTSSDVPSDYDFRYPYYEYVNRKDADDYLAKRDIDESYRIPYIPEKKITLTNAGKLSGVELSTNMLDSIAKYARLAKVPIDEGLGLVGYETNFGKFPGTTMFTPQQIRDWDKQAQEEDRSSSWFINNGGVTPTELTNHHNYFLNSYNDAIGQIARTLGQDGEFIHDASNGYINAYIDPLVKDTYPDLDNYFKQGYRYADRTYVPPKNESPLKSAFEYYKTGRYNSNDSKHSSNVKSWGKQILNSPEIQEWLKNSKFSNGGNLNSGYIISIEALRNR